ncbi:hypothetical protein J1N35_023075 [Gossypium stocksii]|uniref:MULE transposase domain-containing protein n=1 Tax=Gossypium stocksii TaxID=47602 RepID=A0A9D3VJK0_9ROSI|nr:hypothetical protein J1N35_023075 [Gossypium stocksii]
MHNVDLFKDNALEFLDLLHRRLDHTSSLLDSGVSQDHPNMDLDMLASLILLTVKADPRTSMPVLITNIRSQLKYTPSYRKAWIAKQKVLEKMHSRWDSSYNELWQWCQVKEACLPQPDICIISDRGTGILARDTIERQGSLWHRTHHWYCLKHIASNYYRQYQSTNERRQVTNMGYGISKDRFHEILAVFHSINDEGANYLYNIHFEQWTQAYDGGLRYGHITSNLAECINSILNRTCHLPITLVVRETYFRSVALFPKRAASYEGQMQGGHVWCRKIL